MKASDYAFCTIPDDDMGVLIAIVHDGEDLTDKHLGDEVAPFWPKGFEMDEISEGLFLVKEGLSQELVKATMIDAGFTFSLDFHRFVHSGL